MEIRVGIIGPQDSINKIMEVARSLDIVADFVTEVYVDYSNVEKVTLRIQKKCDVLLFSGEGPYSVALKKGILEKPTVFIPRGGTSFYRTVWEIQNKQKLFKRLSSDVVSAEEIKETMEELGIPYDETHYINHNFAEDNNTLIEYHKKLWDSGEIDAAITGFSGVYEALKAHGVSVYKVYPTKSLIRGSLNRVILLGQVKKEKDAQMAIQVVRLRVSDENASSAYNFMLMRNQLEKILIQYTQQNFGALFPFGRDEYLIFTNRGAIENIGEIFEKQFNPFSDRLQYLIVSSGIGFGHTVYDAEMNARNALSYAMQKKHHCIYLKDEAGILTGPFTSESNQWISCNLTSGSDSVISEISEKSGLSPAYVSKLQGLIHKIDRKVVDVNTVANYLGISPRSGRRILTALVETGYAQIEYSESKAQTGRPRKMYTLSL
ncbi:helix-turn-helix domain-containing protein [Fusibacter ferrireducens]|uniref:Transcriptional regulator n=1 Tax=Fusibacter ferrireducens TaxID=2785058 RepID=A0ABR9ZU16_9FIRM|nr:hypothetical protein [Fusibacter ferrireducens]MBF4693064.1 hypothetical protein [Fusibacter ferrireducens]